MANEIKRKVSITWSKGGQSIVMDVDETLNQTGEQAHGSVQIIQGTSEALNFGDVSAPAYVGFRNLNKKWSQLTDDEKVAYSGQTDYETKNTVFVGEEDPTTSVNATHKLKPGAGAQFMALSLAWFACKATDNVNLFVCAIEE
jgi:hypothetical protein